MDTIKLIIKDDTETILSTVNKRCLSSKSHYFETLFNKFKEKNMDEITIMVPNAKITKNIIVQLLGDNFAILPVNKLAIECYDFLSLNYDHLLDRIDGIDELLDIADKCGYTEIILKLITKKLPVDYDTSTFPDNLNKLINYYYWCDKNQRIIYSNYDRIRICELSTGNAINSVDNDYIGSINSIAISADNCYLILGLSTGYVIVKNLKSLKCVYQSQESFSPISKIVVTSNNKYIVSSSEDYIIRVYDFMTGQIINELNSHVYDITSLMITNDNKYIISSNDASIKIWYLETGKLLHTLTGHTDWIHSLTITYDKQLVIIVSGSNDTTIRYTFQ